jgi:hypothetical protein
MNHFDASAHRGDVALFDTTLKLRQHVIQQERMNVYPQISPLT